MSSSVVSLMITSAIISELLLSCSSGLSVSVLSDGVDGVDGFVPEPPPLDTLVILAFAVCVPML
jgi:hypothetical protein